jgi:hypothetical protein
MTVLGTYEQRRRQAMPKMRGTGKDPLGRYQKGLIFDLEDNDPDMVQDFVDKGWAEVLPEEEHPGRTITQIAAAMVRGDELADPVEQALAESIEGREHAIVHLDDPDATNEDYEEEAKKFGHGKAYKRAISADSLGGLPAEDAPAPKRASRKADDSAASDSGAAKKDSGNEERSAGGAAKS